MNNQLDAILRAEAEKRISDFRLVSEAPPDKNLLHELQVHQIELEMQNENLSQIQVELALSRDRYVELYDFAPVAYLTLDWEGRITQANLTAATLLGIDRSVLLKQYFHKYIDALDGDHWYQFFHKNSNVEPLDKELTLRRPDGGRVYVQLSCVDFSDETGNNFVHLAVTDISARKQMENNLRESEEKFRAIFEGAVDGILLMDPESGLFVNANPSFCKSIGCMPGELTNFAVQDIHPPEDISWIVEDIQRHVRGERQMSSDIPVLRRDGSVFYADIRSSPVVLHGKTYLVGVFRDTSTRRELEEVRRISELKHRLLFESSHDALMTLAPPSWQFSGANQATLKLFGANSQSDFLTKGPWGVSPGFQSDGENSAEKALKMLSIAMLEGSNSFEWLHQRMDGTPFFAEVLLTRIDLGAEVFIQATVRDITNRRQADNALRESQQSLRELAAQSAASREAELKNVAREVHDELGQILTAVRMDVSLLRMQFGENNPELHQKIQDMMVLVDKAIQGVRDVTVNLRPPALDMGLVPALTWLTNDFNTRNTTVCSLRLINNPRELTEAQTVVIFRIVQESLTNVARHAAASRVDITLSQIESGMEIAVQDDGHGFDDTLKARKKSFGLLGMKERALAVSGRVNVMSKPGKGTVVSVYIPFDSVKPMRRRNDDTPANS
jgi:PAS domain S-box-containing protein